jgi:hypothetical protein
MSTIAVNAITDANAGNTTSINGVTPNTSNVIGKNILINGAMNVAQRGTSSTGVTASGYYTCDRMRYSENSLGTAAFTIEQSTDAPSGFDYSLKQTTTTAEGAVNATDACRIIDYRIEGQDYSRLAYGTSDAKSVTLSFWVKSSVTGNYSVSLATFLSASFNRIIGSTYTINSANTWEYKTITFVGDTSAGHDGGAIIGANLYFSIGAGSDLTSTDNSSWGDYALGKFHYGQTAQVQNTLNATFQITGVQLEAGSVATEFEHRPYTTELQLCQRYYQQPIDSGLDFFAGYMVNGYYGPGCFSTWYCEMRSTPTVGVTLGSLSLVGTVSVNYFDKKRFKLNPSANGTGSGFWYLAKLTADAEL